MPRSVHEFRDPSRFVAGTVGEPGDRTFFLQVVDGTRTLAVRCEKQQVAMLGERTDGLLDEVAEKVDDTIPPQAAVVYDLDPLEMPVDAEFRVGTMGLGWDGDTRHLVIELLSTDGSSGDDPVMTDAEEGPDALRVFLGPDQARQFALRASRVVSAGRQPCPLCSEPMEPTGHVCVRLNGYHRRDPQALGTLLGES